MVAIPQGNQVMVAAVQASHQDSHVIGFTARVDKVRHLNTSAPSLK